MNSIYCPQPSEIRFAAVDYNNPTCIQGLLRYYHGFNELTMTKMNAEIICIYADITEALRTAGLTNKQKQVVQLYMDGWTEDQIGKMMGDVNKSTVNRHIKAAVRKIQKKLHEDTQR